MSEIVVKYLFEGGLPNHPRRGHECVISWQLEVDPNYCIVKFTKKIKGRPNIEICHISNLVETKKRLK